MLLSTLLIGDSRQVRGLLSLVLGCAVHGVARCGRLVAATLLCARALGMLALGAAERARWAGAYGRACGAVAWGERKGWALGLLPRVGYSGVVWMEEILSGSLRHTR